MTSHSQRPRLGKIRHIYQKNMADENNPSSVKISPGAVVCVEAEIRGDVTIGARTVVHPRACIIAESGPIVIGESNLIEEQVLIINKKPDNGPADSKPETLTIGSNNVFEVGCRCESLKIGDHNVVEAKAAVGRDTELTRGCVIGAFCEVTGHEALADNTIIYGDQYDQRRQYEKPPDQTLQLDFLMKILPNYHRLKKSTKTGDR
ncbi:dynactin subunit 6-like isoform X3 [Apostichopus japonicus]|uniref:dynactin subunit 6-like isoform X3 n=1 Tax=Stichopus japonicus TaxID=307972 RepID=UPI003AB53FE5